MKKYLLVLSSLGLLTLASCLKDKGVTDQVYGTDGVDESQVTIGITPLSGSPDGSKYGVTIAEVNSKVFAFDPVTTPVTIDAFQIHLNSPKALDKDLTLTLAVDDALVDSYNEYLTANDKANVTNAAASLYTLNEGSLTVTLPKGSKSVLVPISATPTDLFSGPYAVGVKIVSTSDASVAVTGNMGSVVLVLGAKNKYDGIYSLKGHHVRSPYNYPYYGVEMHMRTLSINELEFFWPDAGSIGHPIGVGPGSDVSWYGAAIAPVIQFDVNTDLVTGVYNQGSATPITMFTGTFTGTNYLGQSVSETAGVSKYDPDTKTIYVYWNYNANPARAFMDTLTYVGPRP